MQSKLSEKKKTDTTASTERATLRARNPKENIEFGPQFDIANPGEISAAATRAAEAFPAYGELPGAQRAEFLNRIAAELEQRSQVAIETAHAETGLPIPRLTGELGRTTGQLRMFANLAAEGSWVDARIDHGDAGRQPAPKPDLRRMMVPLGPIAVFGASNFPFAFSVAGSDTSSALAAGCPVVVKAHPAHPGTSEIAAQAILAAATATNMPDGVFSMLHGAAEVGRLLVLEPEIQAVAFTGSFAGGMALSKLVTERKIPIPVYAEMGSTNPVVVLPDSIASAEDRAIFAKSYSASVTLGVGQFCTNPGILLGIGKDFVDLCDVIEKEIEAVNPGTMLTAAIAERYRDLTDKLRSHPHVRTAAKPPAPGACSGQPMLLRISGDKFLADPDLAEEIFGPSGLAIACKSVSELLEILDEVPGQLTASVHTKGQDPELANTILRSLAGLAGRVIYNGFPTGVEVSPAMQHGGPFPATLDAKWTSVGTAAIFRFARAIAFQDVPDRLLPLSLQEANPLNIRRWVDGKTG